MSGRLWQFAAACAALLVIGVLDVTTGTELELYVLYLLPISWAAWHLGLKPSLSLAVASTAAWFFANGVAQRPYSHPVFVPLAALVMFSVFLCASAAVAWIRGLYEKQMRLNRDLQNAVARIEKLSGQLPICLSCKSIRTDAGRWVQLEEYFTVHSESDFVFQQTICPSCAHHQREHTILYGGIFGR